MTRGASRGSTTPACALAAALALALASAGPASAQEAPPPWLDVRDGVTQPQFALEDAIEETLFVESTVDSDGDGARDRVRIHVRRPGETESEGIDVPVIFEHSPYRGEFGSAVNNPVDFPVLPQEGLRAPAAARHAGGTAARARALADLPGDLDDRYVPRGYAVVLGESIGSAGSDGCPTVGDQDEALATRAVIDWLGGRARAFDAAGAPVEADWTTGAVGMTGVSYDGTLANMAATTGPPNLRTIVPVSAISSWYDYYRANGLVVAPHSETGAVGDNAYLGEDTDVLASFTASDERMAQRCSHVLLRLREQQDRTTGDLNAFWRERDYLRRAGGVRASVFVVHGLEDYNVRTKAFAAWWERLAAHGVARKLWLHPEGHGPPPGDAFLLAEHRWFDHWLHAVPNGIADEPRATVQRADGALEQLADWPAPGSRHVRLQLGASDATAPGTLGLRRPPGARSPQSFVDRGRELDADTQLLADPDRPNPNRLAYLTPELGADVRLSGTPWASLRIAVENRTAANLTAVLVDLGPRGADVAPRMVTRGWVDVQNRRGPERSVPPAPGEERTLRFDLQPDDHVFPAGHRIGLVVLSTDHDHTLRPLPGTTLTLRPARSELRLPVVGGRAALATP